MRGSNLGMSKAMALDTLGNAYMYLRDRFSCEPCTRAENEGLLAAADVLQAAFKSAKSEFNLPDFTQRS
jgi:hypothetical protein